MRLAYPLDPAYDAYAAHHGDYWYGAPPSEFLN